MNAYLNKILKTKEVDYVIASDTDSIYLNLGPFVDAVYEGREKTTESVVAFLDKVCDCLLYTSDAADEAIGVDLGGRRIIKKRFPLTLLMVLLVINIFAIINLPTQKLLHYLVRFLSVG